MNRLTSNPFKFGDPVVEEFYFPRPELERTVCQFLDNHIPVVLIGPRRFGKTSFILNLLKNYENKIPYLYIDIFNITSHRDFLQQLMRALKAHRNKEGYFQAFLRKVSSYRPQLHSSIDPISGTPSFDLSFDTASTSEKDVKELIQDALSELENLGEGLIFVIDEFQKIAEIQDQGWLEATLRTHMQTLRHTSFLFTGSRKSIISDMLNNSSRPLYRFCQPIEFPCLQSDFIDWIVHRFQSVGIQCETEAISELFQMVQGTPNYVQMVCFHLVAHAVSKVGRSEVKDTLDLVARQNSYAYQTLLSSLAPTQRRALRLAANEKTQVFARELLERYEISSPAALASAIKALKDKEILDEEGTGKGSVSFDDPLFAHWLRLQFHI